MKNIIVTGCGFDNKGAEAMTYITASELRKRFPDHKILLFLTNYNNVGSLNRKYFDILKWYPIKFARAQKNIIYRVLCLLKNKNEYKEACNIYKNTSFLVDISGYAIGSNWSYKICNDYLNQLEFAQLFNIPYYLLPQSFGPFDFKDQKGKDILSRIKKIFSSAKLICAREIEGYNELKDKFNLKNIELCHDIVLNNKEINYSLIFENTPKLQVQKIKENSVCIIPNKETFEYNSEDNIYNTYRIIIDKLLSLNKNIYILQHSNLDKEICQKIKSIYNVNSKVLFLSENYNCFELNEMLKNFDFIIASRFHSIIHAYKNNIPCIVLGWAIKYENLLKLFKQEEFNFNVSEINNNGIINSIDKMNKNINKNKIDIRDKLIQIQKNNVFDLIKFQELEY